MSGWLLTPKDERAEHRIAARPPRPLAKNRRHHGRDAWTAWRKRAEEEEALSLLEATRRGTADLARMAGEADARLLESEARRLRAKEEVKGQETKIQVPNESTRSITSPQRTDVFSRFFCRAQRQSYYTTKEASRCSAPPT